MSCLQPSCPLPGDPFIRWDYDGVGNRTSETRPAGTTTYAYNPADQLTSLTGPGGTVDYTYDDDGNQTAAGPRTFSYDLANRLTSTTSGSATTTYTYDGDGRRLLASWGTQAFQKTRYLWDPNWPLHQLALERNGAGTLRRRYVHGNDLISMFTGGKAYYYHYDALGSTANLTSNTGAKQWTYAYEPFGGIRTETKNNTSAPVNLMRFTGELFDTDTGLYHLRARQYDAIIGRLLATDPLSPELAAPGVATYVYAKNRPGVLVDPSGLVTVGICIGGNGGLLIGGILQGCIVTDFKSVSLTGSIGHGEQLPAGIGANIQLQVTTACNTTDIRGSFDYVGVSGGPPPFTGALDYIQGEPPGLGKIGGLELGAGVGGSYPVPVEAHFGQGTTGVTQLLAWNEPTDCSVGQSSK